MQDKRKVIVSLTPAGEQLVRETGPHALQVTADHEQTQPGERVTHSCCLLRKMVDEGSE